MRVSDIAEIAGVSVRTVRHYHAIGLMPIPPLRGAWRDYNFEDVALLVRIRTLTKAGIALAEIPKHLSNSSSNKYANGISTSVRAIDAAIDSINEQIADLEERRQRLLLLREQAIGKRHSALPPALADTYDSIEELIAASGSKTALSLFRRERTLIELAAQLGFINDEFSFFLRRAKHQEIADFYVELDELPNHEITDERIKELVEKIIEIIERYGEPPASTVELGRKLVNNRAARLLCLSAAPTAKHRTFVNLTFDRLQEYLS